MDENKQVNNTSQQLGEPTEVKQSMKSDSPAQTNSNESGSEVTEQVTISNHVSEDATLTPEDGVAATEKTEVDPAVLAELTQQIESLKTQVEERSTQYMRIAADFENYRKRMLRDRAEYVRRANEQLLEELLPVLDHFEMGMETARTQKVEPSVLEGFKLVYDQLLGVLLKSGLEPIDAMDTDFDPHRHECISHLPSEHVPADRVIAQTRRGYRLGDYILRAAQVVVSSGPPAGQDMENDGEEA